MSWQDFEELFETLSADIHLNARDKGFWDNDRNDGEMLALAHSELSECLESLRHGNPVSEKIAPHSNAVEELADCVIRVMDMAYARGWDLAGAILAKHEYNKTRPHKHGKAF